MTEPSSKRQPIAFGKYVLLDRINIGGMAEIWRGKTWGPAGDRVVAIKRILPNIAEDEEFIGMFIDEAKITVQLTHTNIAQIYELGHNPVARSYFIAMEYIAGRDLRIVFDVLHRQGQPVPIEVACYVMAEACEGLDYAHRKRDAAGREMHIVHRDVSPQNVLVSYTGEVKLIDFGIAKAANKISRTQAGILKGKFGYMSPEQVNGKPLDGRSDLFAAGICLHELLTGERLFIGESDFAVLDQIRTGVVPSPSSKNSRLPPELDRIVLKALAAEPDHRYASAAELAEELRRFLKTRPSPFGSRELAEFMRSTFAAELEDERQRLAEYADVPPPAAVEPAELLAEADPSVSADLHSAPSVSLTATRIEGSSNPSLNKSASAPVDDLSSTLASPLDRHAINPSLSEPTRTAASEVTFITEAGVPPSSGPDPEAKTLWGRPAEVGPLSGSLRWPGLPEFQARLRSAFGPEGRVGRSFRRMRDRLDPRLFPAVAGLLAVGVLVWLMSRLWAAEAPVGFLVLDAPPGGPASMRVNVGGQDLGVWRRGEPFARKVPAGEVPVVASADGYKQFRATVAVQPGAEPTDLTVKMEPVSRRGRLLVIAIPEQAEIRVQKQVVKPAGVPEPYLAEVPVGERQTIEVRYEGFNPVSREITLTESEALQPVYIRLEPRDLTVEVTSSPTGASIWVAGQELGLTPARLSLDASVEELQLRRRCYGSVTLPLQGRTRIHGSMKRVSGCKP